MASRATVKTTTIQTTAASTGCWRQKGVSFHAAAAATAAIAVVVAAGLS
jgi:hypothetical protein